MRYTWSAETSTTASSWWRRKTSTSSNWYKRKGDNHNILQKEKQIGRLSGVKSIVRTINQEKRYRYNFLCTKNRQISNKTTTSFKKRIEAGLVRKGKATKPRLTSPVGIPLKKIVIYPKSGRRIACWTKYWEPDWFSYINYAFWDHQRLRDLPLLDEEEDDEEYDEEEEDDELLLLERLRFWIFLDLFPLHHSINTFYCGLQTQNSIPLCPSVWIDLILLLNFGLGA